MKVGKNQFKGMKERNRKFGKGTYQSAGHWKFQCVKNLPISECLSDIKLKSVTQFLNFQKNFGKVTCGANGMRNKSLRKPNARRTILECFFYMNLQQECTSTMKLGSKYADGHSRPKITELLFLFLVNFSRHCEKTVLSTFIAYILRPKQMQGYIQWPLAM